MFRKLITTSLGGSLGIAELAGLAHLHGAALVTCLVVAAVLATVGVGVIVTVTVAITLSPDASARWTAFASALRRGPTRGP
jgi:hypothetical protein